MRIPIDFSMSVGGGGQIFSLLVRSTPRGNARLFDERGLHRLLRCVIDPLT